MSVFRIRSYSWYFEMMILRTLYILTDARPSHIYISFSIADVRSVSWDMKMIGDGGRHVIEVPLV